MDSCRNLLKDSKNFCEKSCTPFCKNSSTFFSEDFLEILPRTPVGIPPRILQDIPLARISSKISPEINSKIIAEINLTFLQKILEDSFTNLFSNFHKNFSWIPFLTSVKMFSKIPSHFHLWILSEVQHKFRGKFFQESLSGFLPKHSLGYFFYIPQISTYFEV